MQEDFIEIKSCGQTLGSICQPIFSRLFNNELLSDVTIMIGDQRFHGHKFVLGAFSSKFRELLVENCKEIILEGNPKALTNTLRFIYLGQVEQVSGEDAIELLRIAHQYNITAISSSVGLFLANTSDLGSNLEYFLAISNSLNCPTLNQQCGKYIAENFNDVFRDSLMSLDINVWRGVLSSPKIKVESEEELFNILLNYCRTFNDKKEEVLAQLVPHVIFEELGADYLLNLELEFGTIPIIHNKIHEGYKRLLMGETGVKVNNSKREYEGVSWCWSKSSSQHQFSNKNRTISCVSNIGNNTTIIGNKPLKNISNKIWSIRIDRLDPGGWIGIGVGPQIAETQVFTGSESMWMASANSYLWPGATPTGFTFTVGDIITVQIKNNNMVFYKNGKNTEKTVTGFVLQEAYPLCTLQRSGVTLLQNYSVNRE